MLYGIVPTKASCCVFFSPLLTLTNPAEVSCQEAEPCHQSLPGLRAHRGAAAAHLPRGQREAARPGANNVSRSLLLLGGFRRACGHGDLFFIDRAFSDVILDDA